MNTLIFIRKVRHFSSLLPPSIVGTIAKNSPVPGSTHETCANWLQLYNNFLYLKSIFYKGPLLAATSNLEVNLSPASYITMKAYKNNIKHGPTGLTLNQQQQKKAYGHSPPTTFLI